jgi:hypothetical protein
VTLLEDTMTVGSVTGSATSADGTCRRRPTLRGVFRRLAAAMRFSTEDVSPSRSRRLAEVCAVLADARALIERGWMQDNWYMTRQRLEGSDPAAWSGGKAPDLTDVTGACLVGAVVLATRQRDPRADLIDAGPALDLIWDAWQESRGLGGPGVAGRAAPLAVRAARMHDLTRWNDQPGRTRAEVLRLLDLATSRAIMEAVTSSGAAGASVPPMGLNRTPRPAASAPAPAAEPARR